MVAESPQIDPSAVQAADLAAVDQSRFFHLSLDVFCIADREGFVRYLSPAVQRTLGYTDQELVGKLYWDLMHPDDRPAAAERLLALMHGQHTVQFECRFQHRDGSWRWLECNCPAISPEDPCWYAVCRDVTARIEAQEQAERWKHQMELILDSVADGIYGLDLDGRVTFLNRAAERLLGWQAGEVLGTTRHDLWNRPSDSSQEQPMAFTSKPGELPQAVEQSEFVRRDGVLLPVEVATSTVEENGEVTGRVVAFRDITERRERLRMEDELMAARAVQRVLYPDCSPQVPGFDIAGAAFPARVACGDYFDFIPSRNGTLTVATGDVSGHGLAPALQMVETRAFLRVMLDSNRPLADICLHLNRLLVKDLPMGMFVTLFLGQLDPPRRTIEYVSAGHDATLLRADGSVRRLEATLVPLGLLDDAEMDAAPTVPLEAGDIFLIVTDGVVETLTPDQQLFGWPRLVEVVQANRHESARSIVDGIYRAAREFAGPRPQADDITATVIKCL